MSHQSINYSNIFLNFRTLEDTVCDAGIPEHCLLYVCSGEVEFLDNGKKILLKAGECAFIRKDIRIKMYIRTDKEFTVY